MYNIPVILDVASKFIDSGALPGLNYETISDSVSQVAAVFRIAARRDFVDAIMRVLNVTKSDCIDSSQRHQLIHSSANAPDVSMTENTIWCFIFDFPCKPKLWSLLLYISQQC